MESHRLCLRVEKLEAFLRFLSAAKTEIRYSSLPVESVLRKHGGEFSFFPLSAEDGSDGWGKAWSEAVKAGAGNEGFSRKDIELLEGFGAGFGASDTQGQIAHFSLYENLVSAALEEAKKERDGKSKLYRMLGVCGGAAAAILLC